MRTLPGGCAQSTEGQVAGWRGDWSCCFRGIPQSAPKVFFFLGKSCSILRLPWYKEGPVPSLSPPLQVDCYCLGQGPTWPNSQLSPAGAHGLRGFPTLSLFPSLQLQATRSLLVLLKPVWQGREPLAQLSPRSPAAGPAGAGLGLQSPWSLRWSQGPFCPEAIPFPSVFSVSSILSGLLYS